MSELDTGQVTLLVTAVIASILAVYDWLSGKDSDDKNVSQTVSFNIPDDTPLHMKTQELLTSFIEGQNSIINNQDSIISNQDDMINMIDLFEKKTNESFGKLIEQDKDVKNDK